MPLSADLALAALRRRGTELLNAAQAAEADQIRAEVEQAVSEALSKRAQEAKP